MQEMGGSKASSGRKSSSKSWFGKNVIIMSTKNIIKNIIFFIINKYMKKSHYNILLGTLIIAAIIFIVSVIIKLVANYKKRKELEVKKVMDGFRSQSSQAAVRERSLQQKKKNKK